MNSEIQSKIRMGEKVKDIIIIGAGGFGREVQWLIERINEKEKEKTGKAAWNILGYVDDGMEAGKIIDGFPVLGDVDTLSDIKHSVAVVCAVGNPQVRKKLVYKAKKNTFLEFPNIIDPSVIMSNRVELGEGNIFSVSTIVMVDLKIGDFVIANLDCKIGHDDIIESFVTLNPNVNVSGNVWVGQGTEIGTGTKIIQGKKIGENTVVGAGAVVTKDIPDNCTAVGCPCKPIKFHNIPGWGILPSNKL